MKNGTFLWSGTALRVAGIAALALVLMFTACSDTTGGGESPMTPGTYTETAFGYLKNSEYEVTVIVDKYRIVNIYSTATSAHNTASVGMGAVPILVERVLEEQTANVDTVTGATLTSVGFLDAVERALAEAGAPGRMYEEPKYSSTELTVDCDVLVVGAGMAGLSAALSAKSTDSSKTVILIDMTDIYGGSSRMSGAVIGLPGTDDQAGKDDMVNWFYSRAQGDADEDLLKRWADQAPTAYRFVTGRSSALPTGTDAQLYPSGWARGYYLSNSGTNVSFVDTLAQKVKNAGVVFWTNVRGNELIQDGNGKVIGAKAAARKGINYTFNTRDGVILATGAFAQNEDFRSQYLPGIKASGAYTQQGDGIRMGEAIGADTLFKGTASARGLAYGDSTRTDAWYTQPCITSDGSWPGDDGRYTYGSVFPAKTADEAAAENYIGYRPPNGLKALTFTSADYDMAAAGEVAPSDQASVHSLNVRIRSFMQSHFLQDQLAKDDPDLKYFNLGRGTAPTFASKDEGYNFWEASSIAGLAAELDEPGISYTVLQAAYDGLFEPASVTNYYAIRVEPLTNLAPGGLVIDTDGRVLKKDGNVIPGLYAAGEVAFGQFFYLCYPSSGAGLSNGMTFGYLAGYHAVTGTSRPAIDY
jgi:fumarate reductase flavoprotein subunit